MDTDTSFAEFFTMQVFSYRGWHWDASRAKRITDDLFRGGVIPGIIVNPQEWAAGIKHDPDIGPDPAPHEAARPDFMDAEFEILVDKRHALALTAQDCLVPGIALPSPDYGDTPEAGAHYLIVDGWHRLYRAYTLGWTEFGVFPLDRELERALRVDVPWLRWGVER